jgi:hypothetical protein
MFADSGGAIADLAVLRDQGGVFGPVASTPTAWRLLADTDGAVLASLRAARVSAREVAWMQAAETGQGIPAVQAGGRELPGLDLDLDATLNTSPSEKEQAAPTYKDGFGFHSLQCFRANIDEAMSGRLRPGNCGANTADHHIAVLDDALAQISCAHRYGTQILVRAVCAGSAKAFLLTHIRTLREHGLNLRFSIGYVVTEPVRRAVGRHPHHRAARTTAPRRPTVPVRPRRGPAAPGIPYRYPLPIASTTRQLMINAAVRRVRTARRQPYGRRE